MAAAIQYLLPGGQYVNEGTSTLEYLAVGAQYVNEVSTGVAGGAVTRLVLTHGEFAWLAGHGAGLAA